MISKLQLIKSSIISKHEDEKGVVFIAAIGLIGALMLVGTLSATTTYIEIKLSSNYKTSVQANYIARAGTEHARQVLKLLNADSADTGSFADELANVVGSNMALDGYTGIDDVPVVNTTNLGNGAYTVYLTNDLIDDYTNPTDSNNRVCLTSIATTSSGSRDVVELTVSINELFPLPGAITLISGGADFTGGNSNAKDLYGDDQCGSDPPKPVVALSHVADVSDVQDAISKPDTYHTEDENGNPVTFSDDPDAIVTDITQSIIDDIESNYGIDLLDPVDLDDLVTMLQEYADTVAPDGSTDATVYLGNTGDLQIVVVTGDFTMSGSSNGAGILAVMGTLTFSGSPSYTGLILVIGEGSVIRNGGGNGTLSGGILVANTTGGVLGSPSFVTNGGGNGNVQYCSTAVNNPLSLLSLKSTALREL
ncbi:MAG: hypothetical protein ACYSR0_11805 [Planctomycetota bacterium]|jgi:hypothetical protein